MLPRKPHLELITGQSAAFAVSLVVVLCAMAAHVEIIETNMGILFELLKFEKVMALLQWLSNNKFNRSLSLSLSYLRNSRTTTRLIPILIGMCSSSRITN